MPSFKVHFATLSASPCTQSIKDNRHINAVYRAPDTSTTPTSLLLSCCNRQLAAAAGTLTSPIGASQNGCTAEHFCCFILYPASLALLSTCQVSAFRRKLLHNEDISSVKPKLKIRLLVE